MAARSVDGGVVWLTSNGGDALIADGNDGLVAACCDPTIAWDTFGNLYISYISSDLQSIPIAISTDGGATFSQLTSIPGGNVDQPTVTTGPGLGGVGQALWITYDQSGTQARGAAIAGLGAANVGALGAAQPVTGVNQFGDIVIGPNGQVVVTGQDDTQIQVNTDLDGLGPLGFSGAVIASTTNVDTFDAILSQPSRTIDAEAGLAYDRSGGARNGRLYLVYTDELVDENNDTEIFVRTSDDNGATWSNRVRVNDDTTSNSQWFGKIAVDQTTGDVGTVWYDARNSPSNTTVQLFGSISSDGGATWDTNTRISAGTINGTVSATGGLQLGDYIGLTFIAGVLHPSWSDNSNSTGDNPNGTLAQLDIYTASVNSAVAALTVSPSSIREDAGASAGTITIRRGAADTAADLVLDLFFDDPSEVKLPSLGGGTQVTIPAGQNQIVIPIDAVDDTLLDGTQAVTFNLKFNGATVATATLQVTDFEELTISVNPTSVREDDGSGAGIVTVTRGNTDTNGALIVTLTNSDLSEVSIPLTITIPAGSQSITISLDAVDDNVRDGLQLVTLTAAAVGYQSGSATIVVEDTEGILIDVTANRISEAGGNAATQVKVSRTDTEGPFAYVAKQNFSNAGVYDIPDGGIILSPIVVPSQTSRLTDVDVEVNFQHAWLGDLDIFLVSPNGTRVELFTDLVSNGSRMTNTILDDEANQSILRGTAPYSGSFRPEGLLSRFQQESPAGTWFLEVTDDRTSDIGKLLSWSMTMTTEGLAPATVVLQTSNLNKAGFGNSATKTVVIPANQAEVLVPLDAVDNKILDGNTVVTISAISVNVPGLALGSDTVIVTDKETLTLSVSNSSVSKSSVSEAAGPGALMGTLTRENTDIGLPYTVTLSSSNTGKLTVPTTRTIPANKDFVTFLINAIDNNVVDGDFVVTLTAQTADYGADVTVDINVLDLEPALKLTTATQSVSENAGSLNVTVTRLDQSDLSAAMVVSLTSGPGLTVPATITIPTGQDKVTFSAGIIDNAILDGTRNSNIHAAGNLITAGDLGIKITDYETLSVTVDKSSFLENAGAGAATGTVRRSNTGNLGQALVVALASSDKTELKVPATVTIPAGQASVTFLIDAVNDPLLDDSQNVTITATSAGYIKGTAEIVVLDHEPPVLTGPAATTPSSRPKITWNALAGALRYDIWVSNLSTGVAQILRNVNVPTNSYVPPENLGIGRYRVWVRAIDQLEQPGFWSVGRDFFINTPAVITSPTPGGAIVDSKFPTIVWSAIPDATKYEVWANNLTTGQIRVINRTGANALSTTSYVSTEGLGSGTYQIWVRGLNAQDRAGLWSTPVTYTVLAPPTITQPTGGGTFDRTPTFGWTAVTGATNYDVRIDTTKTNEVVFRDQFVTKTSFTATKDMANGEYRIWVRAQYGTSFSVWSVAKTFSVGLPPQITSVKNVGTPEKPQLQFNWTTISGTEKYELWVNNKATNVRVIYQPNLTTTTFTSPTTLPAGTYRVWVRAVSTMGEITDWSTPVDHVIAASDLPKESLLDVMPASLIFDDGPLARHGSTVQRPEKSAAKADAPITADAAPVTELPALPGLPALPAASVVTSMISVEPAPTVVADHDAVMSEWQSADWWAETSASQVRNDLQPAASARRRG